MGSRRKSESHSVIESFFGDYENGDSDATLFADSMPNLTKLPSRPSSSIASIFIVDIDRFSDSECRNYSSSTSSIENFKRDEFVGYIPTNVKRKPQIFKKEIDAVEGGDSNRQNRCFDFKTKSKLLHSKFKKFIDFIIPKKSFNHLDDYFAGQNFAGTKNPYITAFVWFNVFRHLAFYVIPMSDQTRILCFDYTYLSKMRPIINPLFSLLLWAVKVIEENNRINIDKELVNLIQDVLFRSNGPDRFGLLHKRTDRSRYQPIDYCRKAQSYSLMIWNAIKLFNYFLPLALILFHIQMLNILLENRDFFFNDSHWAWIKLLICEFNVLSVIGCFYFIANTSILTAIFMFFLSIIIFLRAERQQQFLQDNFEYLTLIDLDRYMIEHTQTFQLVRSFNKSFGKSMLIYLLINIPYNVCLNMIILVEYHKQTNLDRLLLALMCAQQSIGIFVLHLLFTIFPRRLHLSSIKRLISLNARANLNSFYHHLKITNYILRFHIKNPYGVLYYRIGLISFMAFFKVSTNR